MGLRSDAASASGSVHAKLKELRSYVNTLINTLDGTLPKMCVASNNVRLSLPTPRSISDQSSNNVKSVRVRDFGTVRVSFSCKQTYGIASNPIHVSVLVDGETIKSYTTNRTDGQTYTLDVTVTNNSLVAIRGYGESTSTGSIYDFKVSWDIVPGYGLTVDDQNTN
jgi:hypothetical protein